MAEIFVYDVVERHLPQDYNDTYCNHILDAFESLINWMSCNSTKELPLLTSKGHSSVYDCDDKLKAQLDSSLFTDKGNELMKSCYDNWISSINFCTPCMYGNFTPFATKLKQLQGNPCYVNAEPNLNDTYKDVANKPVAESFDFLKMLTENDKAPITTIESKSKIEKITESKTELTFDEILSNFL